MLFVEEFLKNTNATTIFVSHDIGLLDRMATNIIHLNYGMITAYEGNYTNFIAKEKIRLDQKIKEKIVLEQKISDLQKFVDRFGSKATKASQAQSKLKQIEKLKSELNMIIIPQKNDGIHVKLPKISRSHRDVFEAKHVAVGYEDVIIDKISFKIERGDKIALVGANGSGKSTFLKTIVKKIPTKSGQFIIGQAVKIAYFAQDQAERMPQTLSVMEHFMNNSTLSESESRRVLGRFLFSGEDVYKEIHLLSGGEKNRLGLAIVFSNDSNFLVLDEPTNHLDMLSINALKQVLHEYEGTVLFVSHNQDFTNNTASKCLYFSKNKSASFHHGNLACIEKLILDDITLADNNLAPPNLTGSKNKEEAIKTSQISEQEIKLMQRNKNKLTKRIKVLEKTLEKLESDTEILQSNILDCKPTDYTSIHELNSKIEALGSSRDEKEDEILQAMEELENITIKLKELNRD